MRHTCKVYRHNAVRMDLSSLHFGVIVGPTVSRNAASVSCQYGVRSDQHATGNYFNNLYHYVKDPQCSNVAASIQSGCTLQAVADANNNIVFQNPQPGMRGNFGRNRISGPGEWTLDMAMSKGVRITESTNFQIRLDANNILNHPVASYGSFGSGMRIIVAQPPAVNINGTDPFGYLNSKVGTRTFQITARLNF